MIFRKEAYFTRDMEDYNRAKAAYEYQLFVARKDEEKARQALRSAEVK